MRPASNKQRTVIDYIKPHDVDIHGPSEKPFFRLRLDCDEARKLIGQLENLGHSGGAERFSLTANKSPKANPQPLNLWRNYTAKYELDAAPNYLRGDIFSVTGRGDSCHIDFSATGAALMATHLKEATDRAREFVELVIPNRRRKLNLIEFIADTETEAASEQERLGLAGAVALAEVLGHEDFSDWENA